jgi:hypothetical protein
VNVKNCLNFCDFCVLIEESLLWFVFFIVFVLSSRDSCAHQTIKKTNRKLFWIIAETKRRFLFPVRVKRTWKKKEKFFLVTFFWSARKLDIFVEEVFNQKKSFFFWLKKVKKWKWNWNWKWPLTVGKVTGDITRRIEEF